MGKEKARRDVCESTEPQTRQKNTCFSMPKETHDRMAFPLVHKQYVIPPLAK